MFANNHSAYVVIKHQVMKQWNFLPKSTAVWGHFMMDDMNVLSCGDNDGYWCWFNYDRMPNFDIKGTSIHHCLAQTYIHMLDSSKSNLFM